MSAVSSEVFINDVMATAEVAAPNVVVLGAAARRVACLRDDGTGEPPLVMNDYCERYHAR